MEACGLNQLAAEDIPWPPDHHSMLARLVSISILERQRKTGQPNDHDCQPGSMRAGPHTATPHADAESLRRRETPSCTELNCQKCQLDDWAAWKKAYRTASLRWHPDKWHAVLSAPASGDSRPKEAMQRVHEISQSINEQWESHQARRCNQHC